MHQEQTGGPCIQNLQENAKHGLHFRFHSDPVVSSENLTIAAESYYEGAKPNQTKLVCTRERHKVKTKNKKNSPNRQTKRLNMYTKHVAKAACFILIPTNGDLKALLCHNINLQTKPYLQQIYEQQNRSKDCKIRRQGVEQACQPLL